MMLLLHVLLVACAISAEIERKIDWKICHVDKGPMCFVHGSCLGGSPFLKEDQEGGDHKCPIGYQNYFFTKDTVLIQFQVGTGPNISIKHKNPAKLEIVIENKMVFGCEKKGGKVEIIANVNVTENHRPALFEDKSIFQSDHALCSLKFQNFGTFKDTTLKGMYTDWTSKKIQIRYTAENGENETYEPELVTKQFFEERKVMCDPYSFKDSKGGKDELHILEIKNRNRISLDCKNYDDKLLTYAMKMTKNNVDEEIEKLQCIILDQAYSVHANSTTKELENPEDVSIFCAVAMNKTCKDPFDFLHKPNFTRGTNAESAKLFCPQDRWFIDGVYYILSNATNQPVCKRGDFSKENEAEFYVELPNGDEVRLKEGENAVRATCFTDYDCDVKSKPDYLDCTKNVNQLCGEIQHDNGKIRCKEDGNFTLVARSGNVSFTAQSYTCDVADGQWKDKNGTALPVGTQLGCINEIDPRQAHATLSNAEMGLTICGVAAFTAILAGLIGFFFYRYCKRKSLRDIERVTKKKWMQMKPAERLKYAQFLFGKVTDPKPGTLVQIVHGLDAVELLLQTETEDPEVWEEAWLFLSRLQGALAALDYSVHHQYTRYLYLQAKQIVDKHGWIAPRRITKSQPQGLIRAVAVQLLARCYGDRYYEDSEALVEAGFAELGTQGVEQYPHCGLLWFLMTQVRQQKYSNNFGPNLPEHSFNFIEFCNKLYEFTIKPNLDLPRQDVIPQFESVAMQAAFALGASNNATDLIDDVYDMWQKKDTDDGTKTANFLLGMGFSMCTNPGPKIFVACRLIGDLRKAMLALAPETLWEPNIDVIVRIMVDCYRSLDGKRLQNKAMPDASEEFIINLKSSQRLFEGEARKQIEDIRDWFSARVDLEELKKQPANGLRKRTKSGSGSATGSGSKKASSSSQAEASEPSGGAGEKAPLL